MNATLSLLLLVACDEAEDTGPAALDTDTDTDTDTETEALVELSDLGWRLHDDIGSLVYVSWEQARDADVHVEYSFDTNIWHRTPSFSASTGSQEQILVGIPFGTAGVQWQVVIEDTKETLPGEDIITDALPSGFPQPSLVVADAGQWWSQGNYLLTSINEDPGGWTAGTYWTFIVDREGRVVWASETPDDHWTLYAQVAVTGDHILLDEATYWAEWDSGASSTIHRRYLDAEIDEIATPGLHHAFVQLPDETLVWGSQYHGGGEALVERNGATGLETILWTCDSDWPEGGNCESNGLFYQESTDSFLYSFYTNESLVEIDRSTGANLWWAGTVSGGYSFVPQEAQFAWQHGVSYTATGSLLVSTEAGGSGDWTTMVREYTVDHSSKTLTEIWSHDSERYAATNGDAWRLENDNTLHLLGSAGQVKEITSDGIVVWHLDFNPESTGRLLGRGELITDLYALVAP